MSHKSAENRLEEEEKKLERGAMDVGVKDTEMARMKTTREWVKRVMGDGKDTACVSGERRRCGDVRLNRYDSLAGGKKRKWKTLKCQHASA